MAKRNRSCPGLEALEERGLMAAGVSASLSQGVLTVVGKSVSAPIVVDVLATPARRGVQGTVVVEGVATYKASQVKKIVINALAGETVDVNRSPKWNPRIQVVTKLPPVAPQPVVVSPPVSKPVVTTPTVLPPVTSTETPSEQAIIDAVNKLRADNGLAPLKVDGRLVAAAQIHAQAMAGFDKLAHNIPEAAHPQVTGRLAHVGYDFIHLSENLASGYPDTQSVMNFWMKYPSFRESILSANYTDTGVGVAYTASGVPYYCQVFASPAH